MSDDLVAIIFCCILGLMAHGARRHVWIEWVLRVLYGFFFFGELTTTRTPGYSEHVLNAITLVTGLLLFRPSRQLFSIILTIVNQLISGRFLLAAFGKLQVPVPVSQPALSRVGPEPIVLPELALAAPTSSAAAKAESAPEESAETSEGSKEATEKAETEATAAETDWSAEGDESGKSPVQEAETAEASTRELGSPLEAEAEKKGEQGNQDSSELETQDLEKSESAAEATEALPSAAGGKDEAPKETPYTSTKKVGFFQSFLAEKVFMADSIPHMNGLFIYVTTLSFLLLHTDPGGFEMPSIMIPLPVTMDQLFSYNLFGLILLAFCGCGIFVSRNPLETLRRLGLVKPSLAQVFIGIAGIFVTFAYDWLWSYYTHGQTGLGYAQKLTNYNEGTFAPSGSASGAALVATATGFCAGLGEETLIRGAIQPALGIVPAAFLHGALHGQFSHAPMLILQVFGWSMLMGILRRYTNTTTTIITHVGFNFLSTFIIAFNP